MTRPTRLLSTALSLVFLSTFACEAASVDAPIPAALATPALAPLTAPAAEPTPRTVEPVAALFSPPNEADPVLASAMPLRADTTTEPSPTRLLPSSDDLRSPSLVPSETPAAHLAAFTRLPVAKRDKAPMGGVGATGIHLDELEVGKGWASSRCQDLGNRFDVGVDERVSVCFRVVHPRVEESLSLEWARDGKLRQVIRIGVAQTHAHLTRAWLPVTAGRAGDWTATVKSEDGSTLGQVTFTIAG